MKRITFVLSSILIATPAFAVDGVIEISHARVLARGITPGDTPGYPATLSSAGSYRLTGMLTQPDANTAAIVITGIDVSLDLNGFGVRGPVTCTGLGGTLNCTGGGTASCIHAPSGVRTRVQNGTLYGCGNNGLDLRSDCQVDAVRVQFAARTGINLQARCNVSNSMSNSNGLNGVSVSEGSLVRSTVANFNRASGFASPQSASFIEVTGNRNGTNGVVGSDLLVFRASARFNGGIGISVLGGTAQQSLTSNNGASGIDGGSVHNCRMRDTTPLGGSAINAGGNICGTTPCP